jgi:hypothetical protein
MIDCRFRWFLTVLQVMLVPYQVLFKTLSYRLLILAYKICFVGRLSQLKKIVKTIIILKTNSSLYYSPEPPFCLLFCLKYPQLDCQTLNFQCLLQFLLVNTIPPPTKIQRLFEHINVPVCSIRCQHPHPSPTMSHLFLLHPPSSTTVPSSRYISSLQAS